MPKGDSLTTGSSHALPYSKTVYVDFGLAVSWPLGEKLWKVLTTRCHLLPAFELIVAGMSA